MISAAAKTSARWSDDAQKDLISDALAGVSLDDMAAKYERGRNAIEQKLSWLRKRDLLIPANDSRHRERAARPNQDALHVIACLAQGGFPAINPDHKPAWRMGNAKERADMGDAEHASSALAEGGFPALNEMHRKRGQRIAVLPLIYPNRL